MAHVQIEIDDAGVQELLHEVGAGQCAELAAGIAASCGDGYDSDTYDAGTRMVASAYTATEDAYKDNLANNTLVRALGNGTD